MVFVTNKEYAFKSVPFRLKNKFIFENIKDKTD